MLTRSNHTFVVWLLAGHDLQHQRPWVDLKISRQCISLDPLSSSSQSSVILIVKDSFEWWGWNLDCVETIRLKKQRYSIKLVYMCLWSSLEITGRTNQMKIVRVRSWSRFANQCNMCWFEGRKAATELNATIYEEP